MHNSNIVYIPTINDNMSDFQQLFSLLDQAVCFNSNITFNFSKCRFMRPNATAFLGGLARLIEHNGHSVYFDWQTLSDAMLTNLCQCGFAYKFGHDQKPWDGNSVPYREDLSYDPYNTIDFLIHNWIGRGWVHVSNKLSNAIAGKMWEIYNNAFEHGHSKIGIFTCGQYFAKLNTLTLSVIDFGCGIPNNVIQYFKMNSLPDHASCMRWAFGKGNSTSTEGIAKGLGLDLLKEFVSLNNGKLEIYSNCGFAKISHDGEDYGNSNVAFKGTLVHITLKCDERLYKFKNEV